MFFHIDESGNTGNNLFDSAQPTLSYGVLSCPLNVEIKGRGIHSRMLEVLGVESLHANELGVDKLSQIAPLLYLLQKNLRFDFDYYFIEKPTYAVVIFFDAVFDAGLNDAVKWDLYWTPLRFLMIGKLSTLFDENLLKESWRLGIHRNIETQADSVVNLLTEVRQRLQSSQFDARTKELASDALSFGIANPLSLDFGVKDDKILSPNSVCFQFVVFCMAMRLRKKKRKKAFSIIVDQQHQFNKYQAGTHYNAKRLSEGLKSLSPAERQRYVSHPLFTTLDENQFMHKGIPATDLTVMASDQSIGLQIVDIYLWIANRILKKASLSEELQALGASFLGRSTVDGISMDGMEKRWCDFEQQLPAFEDLTEEQIKLNHKLVAKHRERVAKLNLP